MNRLARNEKTQPKTKKETMASVMKRGLFAFVLMSGLAAGKAETAFAQSFPNMPVHIVVPFAAGGPADLIARIFSQQMAKDLGQPVIVENIGGAGGTIATTRVANAEPDGYTLVMSGNSTHSAALAFYDDLRYDPVKDFKSVGTMSTNAEVIIARKNFPPNNLKELIAYLKQNGAKVNNGHGGVGSISYSACVIFNTLVGANPTLIAYRGVGPATVDMIAGVVDYVCDQVPSAMGRIRDKSVKAYVVTTAERQAAIPDVPTANEAGIPQYKIDVWYGLSAPKGTPDAVIGRLNKALRFAQDEPSLRKRIAELGGEIPSDADRTPKHLDDIIQNDLRLWVPMLAEARKKLEKK